VFASIDAGLRQITEEISRKQVLNRDDAAEIAACAAELTRTAAWEHEDRWQQLCAQLAEVTAALTVADTPAAAPPATNDPSTQFIDLPATTDRVSAEAITAAEQAVPEHAGDAAWQPVTTPIAQCVPAALASLELLRTFAAADAAAGAALDLSTSNEAAEAEAEATLQAADAATDLEADEVVMLDLPHPAGAIRPRLIFGDLSALAQLHLRHTTKAPRGAALPPSAPDQLDLFATLELPIRVLPGREQEPVPLGVEQLALL
jgi:hypothetical protein